MKYKVHTITVAGVIKSTQDAHTPDEACKKATGLYGGSSVVTESGEMNSETLITILNLRAAKIK